LTKWEADDVFALLREKGFEESSAGVKAYLIALAGSDAPPAQEGDEETSEPGLSRGLRVVLEKLHEHPEVIHAVKKEGSRIAEALLKKIIRK
jgi:hypothetical protein